jgi:hypothetical protein
MSDEVYKKNRPPPEGNDPSISKGSGHSRARGCQLFWVEVIDAAYVLIADIMRLLRHAEEPTP